MGDTLTFTTWQKHQNLFYKINTHAVYFEIRAPGNAIVGLGKKPSSSCDYWVGIGDENHCWIKKENEHGSSALIRNVITAAQYRRFWLTWAGGCIRFGSDGETKPIVSYSCDSEALNYVTFGVLRSNNPVEWRLELPPMLPKPQSKSISGGKLTWVTAEDQLPEGALIGGFENETLYVIRAQHMGSLTPGKFVPSEGTAYLSWGGDAHEKSTFEVLCGYDCTWVPTFKSKIPAGAFPAGYSEEHHETLYIGRAEHNGHLIPGKVQPSHEVCYIPFEGKEISKQRYEILVDPSIIVMSANANYLSTEADIASDSEQEEDNDEWSPDGDDDSDGYNEDEHVFAF